jgi:pimeloyl-ACP methyl ester carboxylesterase
MPRIASLLLIGCLALAANLAATCHKPGTRVVIFVQGVYTSYDAAGTQGTALEAHRFDTIKAAFRAQGYDDAQLLDFSYTGGAVNASGAWKPLRYTCDQTDRPAATNMEPLETMMRDYRARHRDVHFTLVGHSLGGYLVFLAGARDAARVPDQRLGIDAVVTLDAPLKGVSADKKIIFDFIPCERTYEAGAELVAARLDPATADVRRYQAGVMAGAAIRLGTFGNAGDCLWNTARCLGGGWIDDSETQFLDDAAAASMRYDIVSDPLYSHDAILADATAAADVVAFVGAP